MIVKTGRRALRLRELLTNAGVKPATAVPPRPRLADLPEAVRTELLALYRTLGGLQETPKLLPGGWDLVFADDFVVELDEELHFNRYRATTLEASWAAEAPWTEAYRSHCGDHEGRCLRSGAWGRRWTNASSAQMFSGGPEGDLTGDGAPRWKQRAIYDVLKDAVVLLPAAPALARVATHDKVDGVRLEAILDGDAVVPSTAVRTLVEMRTAAPT